MRGSRTPKNPRQASEQNCVAWTALLFLSFLFDRNLQRAKKLLILRCEFEPDPCFAFAALGSFVCDLDLGWTRFAIFFHSVLTALVESDRGLENEEHIEACVTDLADRRRDSIRIGQRVVDEVAGVEGRGGLRDRFDEGMGPRFEAGDV